MKLLHCSHCHALVFFENSVCVNCGHLLAFDSAQSRMIAFAATPDGSLVAQDSGTPRPELRLCQNHNETGVCNWATDASQPSPLCPACQFTRTLPQLDKPGNLEAWAKIEAAKRAFLYDLLPLGLFPASWQQDPERGLAFDFLEDQNQKTVLTGHDSGLITLNIAEADDVERERRRSSLGEPFRSLLGHFRHESGHYFWDRLIREQDRLDAFRAAFGDEREDYGQALQRYHGGARKDNWETTYITEYASAHPWEDWAETWAHYLHLRSVTETARACGLRLEPARPDEPTFPAPQEQSDSKGDSLLSDWTALSYLVNQLNRSLGLRDPYPIVLHSAALEKLRFVHALLT